MVHPDFDYDEIADQFFYPVYDVIADDILESTNVKEGNFLDVGSGGGHLGFSLIKKTGMNAAFADLNPAAIEIAQLRAEELGVRSRCSFCVADVETLPFEDNSFDLIISRGSIPFWKNQEKALLELFRVLAKGGKTYIGCGLGNMQLQQEIQEKMHENGMKCFFEDKDKKKESFMLSTAEYAEMLSKWDCKFRIIEDDNKGTWLLIEK